jgi:hypothetical protein
MQGKVFEYTFGPSYFHNIFTSIIIYVISFILYQLSIVFPISIFIFQLLLPPYRLSFFKYQFTSAFSPIILSIKSFFSFYYIPCLVNIIAIYA